MSLQNLQLSGLIMSELYKNTLVSDETVGNRPAKQDIPENEAIGSEYKFLGKNQKKVVIIVRYANETFIPEDHLQFLTKILGACRLNLGDVAILNDSMQKIDIVRIKQQLEPEKILLFGIEPAEIMLPINFPDFKQQAYAGSSYLYIPSMDLINQENDEGKLLKRKLWDCLKKMFEV